MAASIVIEEERGTYRGTRHAHNGYYAGDFGATAGFGATGAGARSSLPQIALRAALTSSVR